MPKRSYKGDPIDESWQYFHERPAASDDDQDGAETIYATDAGAGGDRSTENVPLSGDSTQTQPPDTDGQTEWSDWEQEVSP